MRRGAVVAVLSVLTASLGASASPLQAKSSSAQLQEPHPGRIVYASDVDGDYEIFVMRADGTRRRQITHNRVYDVDPSWAPDGTHIVFEREAPSYGDDLYIADLDGGPAVPWVTTKNVDEGEPRWSPDGEMIAYRRNGEFDDRDVVLSTLDHSAGAAIWARAENGSVGHPAWSPDGSKVAFIESDTGSGIAVAEACCTSNQESVATAEWAEGLDWSPDGSCLAFTDVVRGRGDLLHTVAAGGGTARAITRGDADAYLGSWSPDASRIVYYSNAARSWDIYVVGAGGGDARRLTRTRGVNEVTPDWWAPAGIEPVTPPCGE